MHPTNTAARYRIVRNHKEAVNSQNRTDFGTLAHPTSSAVITIEASPSAYPSGRLAWGKAPHASGGALRRGSTNPPHDDCGVDRPARRLYGCLGHHAGEILVHRPMHAAPAPWLKAVAPERDGLAVAVDGLFTGDLAG
jgi:hypothetical protein